MKKKLIGFILCGLILATAAGCSDTPTQVSQISDSSLESADVTSDREDKDNSDDITAKKDQLSQTADSASTESQLEIPAEKKEESVAPPASQTDKPKKNDPEASSAVESKPTEPENQIHRSVNRKVLKQILKYRKHPLLKLNRRQNPNQTNQPKNLNQASLNLIFKTGLISHEATQRISD